MLERQSIKDVLEEREKQISNHWDEKNVGHSLGEMVSIATTYLAGASDSYRNRAENKRSELVKACAFILQIIDHIDNNDVKTYTLINTDYKE